MAADQNPEKRNLDNQKTQTKPDWQQGLQLFFQLSGWLVGPLVVGLFLGQWLDERYQTKPWLFLATTGLAFAVTCFGIVLKTREFIKQIENDSKKEIKSKNPEMRNKNNEN